MRLLPLLALLLPLAEAASPLEESTLAPPEKSYNILMLLPVSSKSHRNVFMPLATALTKRGHKITMVSNHPPHDKNPAITYINHGLPHFREDQMNLFQQAKNPDNMFKMFKKIFPLIARDLYDVPEVKDLYERRNEFDVFIIDQIFNEATLPFAHGRPLIMLSTGALDPSNSAMMGNLQNPAYVANLLEYYPQPFSFVHRIRNLFFSVMVPLSWKGAIRETAQVEISKRFPDLPSLADMEREQNLNFINGHWSFGEVLPLLPNQVEVGGMHLRPGKPLPKDLEEFVSGSTPVIYFSLGSVAKSTDIAPEHKKALLEAFAKLPYKVLWKYEETFPDLPKNVRIQKWMPQQDVLAHPNVAVFITHCGALGTQEALYNGVPMLGLPIFGDQPRNADVMLFEGYGRYLKWEELTSEALVTMIMELVRNPSYRAKAQSISSAFRDQLMSPTDRAVYWTEYIIRHEGAPHLRSPEKDLTWIQLLHLDIIALVHVTVILSFKIIKKLLSLCCGKKDVSAKKKRE